MGIVVAYSYWARSADHVTVLVRTNTGHDVAQSIAVGPDQWLQLFTFPHISLHHQIDALDSQLADREVYLKLADNLEDFLTGLRDKTATATVTERQRVLRLLVKDVLVGPDKITIRHCIPVRHHASSSTDGSAETDTEGETRTDCQLRWRSRQPLDVQHLPTPDRPGMAGA